MILEEFLKALDLKFDVERYTGLLSLQGQSGHFLRKYFGRNWVKILDPPLPEMVKNGVLLHS